MAGKKTGKRLLTWVLVLVMALSLLPLNVMAALNTGHKIDVRFTVLYVGDEFNIGYNYGTSEKTQFVCQYTTNHSDTAYNNHTIAISDIKAAASRATVNSGYQIVGWSKEAKANPTTWSLDKSGTTACNKGTTIYLVAKNPNPQVTYTLTYYENTTDPVTNMPSPKTVTLKSSTSPVTFTVSGNKPKRDDYTFLGWAGNSNATEPTVQPGNTITTPATTTNLYAVWQSNTPPTDKPAKPTENDVTGVVVDIVCVTTTGTHVMVQYPLGHPNDAQHTIGEVVSDGAGGYICPVTVRTPWFVQQASDLVWKVQHTQTASTITFNLTYDKNSKTWVKPAANPRIEATHEVTPPEAPTDDELKKLEMAVLVKCDVDDTQQHTEAYGLLGEYNEDYFVGAPKKDGDDWLCEISYDPDLYVAEFNTAFPNLKHVRNDEKIVPVTLIWADGSWQLKTQGSVHVTEEYTVTFNAYGGFPTPDEQHVKSGEKAVLPAEPTLKGHTFAFWYLGDDEENATAYDFDTPVTGDITLTAKWNINKYTVTFNSYGGTPVPPAQEVEYGLTATKPDDPTLKGYTFAFWYLGEDEENATAYDFNTPVTENITLTAKWNINKYTVTFNSYGGTPVPPAQEVEYGLTATEPATAPTKTGYAFDGWYLGDEKYDFSDAVEQNITLYANWEKNIYTVTYTDGVDGEEVFADQTYRVPFEDTTPAFKGTKTRAGYVFAGWKPAFSDTVTGNVTYVAQWKDDKNNNGIADDEEEKYTVTYTDGVANEEVFADQVYGDLLSGTATPAFKGNPTRDGYVFDGWKPAFSDTVTGNVTYVAQWTARTDLSYTVHYYLKNTTKQVANDKMVAGQTFNADVTENAIRISGYRVYGDSVKSITIGTGTNEIIFYYTRAYHPSTPSKPTLNTGDHYAYVMGYPDGTVRPNGSITRAEVSAILFRLLSDETRDEYFTTESSFTDVKAGAWYNNSIATLEKAGVIVDTAKGGAFRPNEAITRAELAAMLAQFSDAKPVKGVKFSDVSAEHWAYEAIAIAAKMGWIEGYPDGTFRPDATITRAEMMTLVNRALERVPSDEDHLLSKRVMLTFPDCKSGDWFYIAVQEATNSHTYERAATEKNGDEQWTALRANRDWTQLEK